MLTRTLRWAYVVWIWCSFLAVIVQFFLAGLGVFGGAGGFNAHRILGYTLLFILLLDFLLALAARLPWRVVGLAFLLPVLVLLQSVFIQFWQDGQNTLAAFHVLNALLIFTISGALALRSRAVVTAQPTAPEATGVPTR
jgi:hypothetical protein